MTESSGHPPGSPPRPESPAAPPAADPPAAGPPAPAAPPPPAPVRPPAPARPGPPPRAGGGVRPDRGGGRKPPGPPRPAPARQGAESAAREPLRPIELPFLPLRVEDENWIVREGGLTASGQGGGPRAPLLLLFFARADDPERPLRELLVAARRLDDLDDRQLLEAFAKARPFREDRERREVFPDTRKRGSKGI